MVQVVKTTTSQGHEMEVMGSNRGWVELGVSSTSV